MSRYLRADLLSHPLGIFSIKIWEYGEDESKATIEGENQATKKNSSVR